MIMKGIGVLIMKGRGVLIMKGRGTWRRGGMDQLKKEKLPPEAEEEETPSERGRRGGRSEHGCSAKAIDSEMEGRSGR